MLLHLSDLMPIQINNHVCSLVGICSEKTVQAQVAQAEVYMVAENRKQ
jgi:hypothetical protein